MLTSLRLADLIVPQSVENFITETYSQGWVLYEGDAARFHGLADWGTLNHLLETQRYESPRFRVARRGEVLPAETYTEEIPRRGNTYYKRIMVDRLLEEIRGGATVTIDRVDQAHPPIRELAASLELELRSAIFVNMFASWQAVPGFDVHWDDHDVFVIQLDGRKHWQIFEPTRRWPLYRDVVRNEPPEGLPLAEFDMTAGDVLYLTHGWWHSVSATGEPSLHITIGVSPDNGIDFMSWLVDQMRSEEIFRRRLPRLANSDAKADFVNVAKRRCDELLNSSEVLDKFFREVDATSRGRPAYLLPKTFDDHFSLDLSDEVYLTAPRATVSIDNGRLVLAALGRQWAFSDTIAPVMEALTSSGGGSVEDLAKVAGDVPIEQIGKVLSTLLKAGVLGIRDNRE